MHCLPQARDDARGAAEALERYSAATIEAEAIAPNDAPGDIERWCVEADLHERPGPSEYDIFCAYALKIDDCTRSAGTVRLRLVR